MLFLKENKLSFKATDASEQEKLHTVRIARIWLIMYSEQVLFDKKIRYRECSSKQEDIDVKVGDNTVIICLPSGGVEKSTSKLNQICHNIRIKFRRQKFKRQFSFHNSSSPCETYLPV